MEPATLKIEVVYATAQAQVVCRLTVACGTTALEAVRQSGILQRFDTLSLDTLRLGVFSRPISADYGVKNGDRVEIYRQLIIDPKAARRQRVQGR
jgi:putative ubiquitin-RnfH superfamily antitoxin RatB of RatAB toxin-antitoxin module